MSANLRKSEKFSGKSRNIEKMFIEKLTEKHFLRLTKLTKKTLSYTALKQG